MYEPEFISLDEFKTDEIALVRAEKNAALFLSYRANGVEMPGAAVTSARGEIIHALP